METKIKSLIGKAASAASSIEAIEYSQAAVNSAQAMALLEEIKRSKGR